MKSKKNISILTISMNGGGAEKVISLLLKELVKDYNVHLILFHDIFHFEIPEEVTVKILSTGSPSSSLYKIFDFPKQIIEYQKYIKNNQIDVAISFLTRPNLINGFLRFRNKKVKTIISERCFPSISYKTSKSYTFYRYLIPLLYNKVDKIFSNSVYINQDLKDNFGVKKDCDVIYNPVIEKDYKSYQCTQNDFKVITVGSLRKIKNQKIIIDAVAKLDNTQLNILGNGPLKDELSDYVTTQKLTQKIHFKGQVTNVFEYLNNSCCFVLSSNSEGFPNALIEAMSIGLPVISTNCVSGPLEILNDNQPVNIKKGEFYLGEYGILINVNDSIGLKKAIEFYKNNLETMNEYGQKAYSRSKDFNLKTFYDKVKLLIED